MKKKIWGVLLSVAVLVTTVNFPTTAGAEENKGGADASGIVVKVSDDMNGSNANESDEIQTVQISAQNQSNMDAVVRIFLLNEDKETADTDVEIPNLCEKDQITDETVQTELDETLKSALTLESGTNSALDAQWIEKKDDSGNVTAKYLEAALPAGTAAAFDMQLMYRTDEENYTKKTIVRAKAFVDEQDVTEASDVEDEDNEAEVKWEVVKVEEESEAAEESGETAGSAAEVSRIAAKSAAENNVSLMSSAAVSRSAELNENFIYLDPTGMSEGGLDWESQSQDVYLILINSGWGTTTYKMEYDIQTGFWRYNIGSWSVNTEFNFIFATSNNWSTINAGDYRRTSESPNSIKAIKEGRAGRVYCWNKPETTTFDNHTAYVLKEGISFDPDDHTWFAGETMWFKDNTSENLSAVTAVFYEKNANGTLQEVTRITMQDREDGEFSTSIPSHECSYVRFVDPNSNNETLGDTYSNFYGQGTGEAGVESFIFDSASKYCYQYNGTAENSIWDIRTSSGTTVYFDATLSKLSYQGDDSAGNVQDVLSMPLDENSMYCYAWNTSSDAVTRKMNRTGNSTWTDVYSVDLGKQYENIIFFTNSMMEFSGDVKLQTKDQKIDWSLKNPCFYADSSDPYVFVATTESNTDLKKRDGYWEEAYQTRDAEDAKGTDVVDIDQETFQSADDTLYINSTFYDYYTDYELNGYNRDNYSNGDGYSYTNTPSQRSWVTFRQFDQALSEYYRNNEVTIPIYTGHFQPDWKEYNDDGSENVWGITFSSIADTLSLFGYNGVNSQSGFMSTNNSTMDVNGQGGKYDYAAQGLVSDTLNNDQLMVKNGTASLPQFNEAFLDGDNSKNTKLGEVYHNVSFPFTKAYLDTEGNVVNGNTQGAVEYWYFDSALTTLAMKQDISSEGYYLKDVGHKDWSKNVNSSSQTSGVSTTYGFFPFNETSNAASAKNYNYGFGTKIEFTFRLTDEGTVTDVNGNKVPITFSFSGDDDVWVFIDGKLALDVGGSHGRVTGSLDFQSKQATISNVKASQGSTDTSGNSTFSIEGQNGDVHTLTMYYMERGMWESNMRISFNFPDENLFEVEKELDTSGVDEDFIPALENASFDFEVGNAVTHYGEKDAANDDSEPVEYNDTFDTTKLTKPANDNLFQHEDNYGGYADVVHWKALHEDNAKGEYRNERWGIIKPEEGDSVDISDQEFLSFDFYFADNNVSLSLNNIWLGLEDADGTTVDVNLSAQKIYGSSSLARNRWQTIRVYLDQFTTVGGNNGDFDWTNVTAVKFSYRYHADIYLDNIRFIPPISDSIMTGFVVQQQEIPSYGSVEANQQNGGNPSLQNAEGAVYTLSGEGSGSSGNGRVDENGVFPLKDGQTASFSNQFRIGSYLSLSEINVDPDVFTTSWTLYDNSTGSDIPITSYGSGDSVTVGEAGGGSLVGVSGTSLEDNRVEIKDGNSDEANYTNQSDTSDPSIVFRSYTNPDSEVIITKLKAVVTNKVNTGSIKIRKDRADNSADLSGSYTFNIVFTNVAGLSLESEAITKTVTVESGETATITGIPIGTEYVITEAVSADSDSRLESIEIIGDGSHAVVENNSVRGTVNGSTANCTFQFNNTTRPLIDIHVEKEWQDADGTDIGASIQDPIYVQLQRKYTDAEGTEHGYEPVVINGQNYITIQKSYSGWVYDFVGLEMYQDNDREIAYTYRVVEGTIDEEGNFTPVAESGIIVINGQEYDVAYQYQETTEGTEGGTDITEITGSGNQSKEFAVTIINKLHQRTNLKIVKVDATKADEPDGTEGKYLPGVTFSLEKGASGSTSESFTVDENFGTDGFMTGTTGDGTNDTTLGQLIFEDLEEGIYRITETKAAAGYSLLKSPLYLVIDREYGCTIQEGSSEPQSIDVDADSNTITITVSNRLLFELPSTGGYLRTYMIAGGLALAGIALFIYRLQKRRKGARAPRR